MVNLLSFRLSTILPISLLCCMTSASLQLDTITTDANHLSSVQALSQKAAKNCCLSRETRHISGGARGAKVSINVTFDKSRFFRTLEFFNKPQVHLSKNLIASGVLFKISNFSKNARHLFKAHWYKTHTWFKNLIS